MVLQLHSLNIITI